MSNPPLPIDGFGDAMQRPCVYRLFDRVGVLLYVGQTVRPFERINTHRRAAPWRARIATVTMEDCPEEMLRRREAEVIATEHPLFNVATPDIERVSIGRTNRGGLMPDGTPRCDSVKTKWHCEPERPSSWRCQQPKGHDGLHTVKGQSPWGDEDEREQAQG